MFFNLKRDGFDDDELKENEKYIKNRLENSEEELKDISLKLTDDGIECFCLRFLTYLHIFLGLEKRVLSMLFK